MNTIKIVFTPIIPNEQDMLMALLLEKFNIDGFEQDDNSLIGYIQENAFIEKEIKLATEIPFTFTTLPAQNWNALWESNFDPVIVGNFCGIRANFHDPIHNVTHEIIITPKMSFGTGHHATTYQVIKAMEHLDFTNKTVCDFGTGTGLLAILANKLGATTINAIDNDDWSIENTIENININNCKGINVIKATTIDDAKYNIILANINKNILLANMLAITRSLKINGYVIFSGILNTDKEEMEESITSNGLTITTLTEQNNWLCIVAKILTLK